MEEEKVLVYRPNKPKTKAEKTKYAKLQQRVSDIYSGAIGGKWNDDDYYADAEMLSTIYPAIIGVFEIPEKHWVISPFNIKYFCDVVTLTLQLWTAGVEP